VAYQIFPSYSEAAEIPSDEKSIFTLAKSLYADGLFDMSVKQFDIFIKNYPDSSLLSDAYFYTAEAFKKSGRYKDAVLIYGKILDKEPAKADDIIKRIAESLKNIIPGGGKRIKDDETLLDVFVDIFQRYPEKGYSTGLAYYYANSLYQNQKYNEALWIFERLAEKIPQDVPQDELFYKLGECYYRTGNLRLSSEKWFYVVKKYPKSKFAEMSLYNSGVIYFTEGDYKEARARFEKLINNYSESSLVKRSVYGIAWSLWKEEMHEDTIHHISIYEGGAEEKDIISICEYFYKKDFVRAYEDARKSFGQNHAGKYRDAALYLMGRSTEEMEDAGGAIELYLQLIKEFPGSPYAGEAYVKAGKIYLSLRDLDSAINLLKSYREKHPTNPPFSKVEAEGDLSDILQIGNNYLEKGETEKAIELYRGILDNTSDPLLNILIKGRLRDIYIEKGMHSEYIELSPDFNSYEPVILTMETGEANHQEKTKHEEGKEDVVNKPEIPLQKIESNVITLYMTADALAKSGRIEKAHELFKKIIDEYQNEEGLDDERLNIGLFFLKGKEYDIAIKSFAQVIKGSGDNKLKAEAHFWMGESFQNSDKWEEAALEYLKVAYLYPENDLWSGTARFRAGEIFEMQGKLNEAALMYQKLAAKYKNDERGKFAAKKMEEIKKLRNKEQKPN
jgi:TolA-binding protein